MDNNDISRIGVTALFLIVISSLCGIIILAIGLHTLLRETFMDELLGTKMYISSCYLLVCVGSAIIFFPVMGFFGILKNSTSVTMAYTFILFGLATVLLIAALLGFLSKSEIEETIEDQIMATLQEYQFDDGVKKTWDDTQSILKCCGVHRYEEWNGKLERGLVPLSCCVNSTDCTSGQNAKLIHQQGCQLKIMKEVRYYANFIASAALVTAFVLLANVVVSCTFVS